MKSDVMAGGPGPREREPNGQRASNRGISMKIDTKRERAKTQNQRRGIKPATVMRISHIPIRGRRLCMRLCICKPMAHTHAPQQCTTSQSQRRCCVRACESSSHTTPHMATLHTHNAQPIIHRVIVCTHTLMLVSKPVKRHHAICQTARQ